MKALRVISVVLAVVVLLCGWTPPTAQVVSGSGPQRQGAWLDVVVVSEEPSAANAILRLQRNDLDLYAVSLNDSNLFQTVLEDPSLTYTESYGSYNELTFNPYGPHFADGRLNPFSNYKIREAMNWLIDRNYIAQVLCGGLATPRYLPINRISADRTRYQAAIEALEAEYAYDWNRARTVIASEMVTMGATMQGGIWYYNGRPVTIIVLIRVEDVRRLIGDYVADQLAAVGFAVERQYKTAAEASPIWIRGNPAEGKFHVYTGNWITTSVPRDLGLVFDVFYTPRGMNQPLWQAYQPSPEFDEVARRLAARDFSDMSERDALFTRALRLAMNDTGSGSVRVWLVDRTSFMARRAGTSVGADAYGVMGAAWPYVARFTGQEGGTLRVATPDNLMEPWNPIGGTNWFYDWISFPATQDYAFLPDPLTGLQWPQRALSAQVVVKQGLPVTKTLDWVTLSFAPQIEVPADAWVDWDASAQRFITRAEKYPAGLTAKVKSTVTYPANLFSTVRWHDGSPLDAADFVLKMILTFDRGKPESPIYDQSARWALDTFLSSFRGVRIESLEPLVITTYHDDLQLDAELLPVAWWPNYDRGPGAWHTIAAGIRAEAAGELAFSSDKAASRGIPWMDFVDGPSLAVLQNWVNRSAIEGYIPYRQTMSTYVSQAEANARWAALQAWYAARGHFWVGTGPFYLENISRATGTLTLRHNPAFPDAAGRWDVFAAAPAPAIQINHTVGAPGSYFNVTGSGFPPDSTAHILINGRLLGQVAVDSSGAVAFTLSTTEARQGEYHLRVSVNPFAGARFTLTAAAPTREREGELPVIEVPAGLSKLPVYLPMVVRN